MSPGFLFSKYLENQCSMLNRDEIHVQLMCLCPSNCAKTVQLNMYFMYLALNTDFLKILREKTGDKLCSPSRVRPCQWSFLLHFKHNLMFSHSDSTVSEKCHTHILAAVVKLLNEFLSISEMTVSQFT